MKSSAASSARLSRLRRILPFQSRIVRWALASWLALAFSAALWAILVRQPQTEKTRTLHADLFELESQLAQIDPVFLEAEAKILDAKQAKIDQLLFDAPEAIEQRLVSFAKDANALGWRARITTLEKRQALRYSVELAPHPSESDASSTEDEATPPHPDPTQVLHSLLGVLARSEKGRFDIERLQINAPVDGRSTAQLVLAATPHTPR